MDRHPITNEHFKSQFNGSSLVPGVTKPGKARAPALGARRAGRQRATLPRTPAALPVKRLTVSEQDSDERARQRVRDARPS